MPAFAAAAWPQDDTLDSEPSIDDALDAFRIKDQLASIDLEPAQRDGLYGLIRDTADHHLQNGAGSAREAVLLAVNDMNNVPDAALRGLASSPSDTIVGTLTVAGAEGRQQANWAHQTADALGDAVLRHPDRRPAYAAHYDDYVNFAKMSDEEWRSAWTRIQTDPNLSRTDRAGIMTEMRRLKDGGSALKPEDFIRPGIGDPHRYSDASTMFGGMGTRLPNPPDRRLTVEEAFGYLLRHAVPGLDGAISVENGKDYPVHDPITGLFAGNVNVTVDPFNLTVTNQTLEGHIFHDGKVVRSLHQDSEGNWYVRTRGDGFNEWRGTDLANNLFGPMAFAIVDWQMGRHIDRDIVDRYDLAKPSLVEPAEHPMVRQYRERRERLGLPR